MGKTIVITGGGAGLGRAMARRLAADGHRLVLLGRTIATLEAVADEIGGGAYGLACDLTDAEDITGAFAEITGREARIDVLINNAANYEPFTVAEASDAQVAATLDTNLAGTINCTRAALPRMGRGGHIINLSSRTAGDAPAAMLSLYQASKAGVERFTKSLREEVEEQGIRVTLIRAAGMMDADTRWTMPPEVTQRFMEARRKRGIANMPISQFDSVASLLPWLIGLPEDVEVSELMLEGRHI